MSRKANCSFIIGLVIFSFSFLIVNTIFLSSSSLGNVIITENGTQTYTGDYDGDLSIMYLEFNSNFSSWWGQNSSTNFIPCNMSISEREYDLYQLEIHADNIVNGTDMYPIATNTSNQVSLPTSHAISQGFTAPELMSIDTIMLYMNYTLAFLPIYGYYYLVLRIFDETFENEMDLIWSYQSEPHLDEWVFFYPNAEIFEPGKKYNFVLHTWADGYDSGIPIDYWKAEEYMSPSYNKGLTMRLTGGGWMPLPNDNLVDMLCFFTYQKIIDPATVDLKFILDDQEIIPTYQESSFGVWGYEAHTIITFDTRPTNLVNFTVVTNKTLAQMDVWIDISYLYLINATGNYSASENLIAWTIEYPYEELSFGWPPPIFLFERDWNYVSFLDKDGTQMQDIYFGPMNLYNQSFYGIATFFSPPLERGTYTGIFTSPNYCNKINPQLKSGSQYVSTTSIALGQTILLEAEIYNTLNEPITGGLGQIVLKSPSGTVIHNETRLSAVNGIISSSDIIIGSNLAEGIYEAVIFWSNGQEIAYYSINIEVQDPSKIFILAGIIVGIVAVATPLALVARRQLKKRNWEKSLKNLFLLTQDGLSLYEYSFGIEIQDPALISAMIAALTNFVREATGSKKSLRTVDQEDKKVILFHGTYTTTALLAEKDLPIIHKRIRKFAEDFELEYGKHLKGWKGNTEPFKHVDVLVNKYFPLDVEDQIIRGVKQKLIEFREKLDILTDPKHIISLMRQITEFISRYQKIVNTHYLNYYNEIIISAEEKIISA